MIETGPIYNVPLIDTLPLGSSGGLVQQMPSRDDLVTAKVRFERVCAGYEVLLAHYRRAMADADRYRKLRSAHWSESDLDGLVVTCLENVPLGADCFSGDRLDEVVDAMEDQRS